MTILVHSGKIIQLYEAGKKAVWEEFDSHGNRVRVQYDFDLADSILEQKYLTGMYEMVGKITNGNQ